MNNGYYYQLLASVIRESGRLTYPRFLKELVKSGDLDDIKAVEEGLGKEIAEANILENNGAEYFVLLAENALLFALYREDYERFRQLNDVVEKRFNTLRGSGATNVNVDQWLAYLGFMQSAAKRLMRVSNVEAFEHTIENLEWSEFGPTFIPKVSGLTGFVYLNEDGSLSGKARHWLQKATSGVDVAQSLAYWINLADFYLTERSNDNHKRAEDIIRTLDEAAKSASEAQLTRLYRTVVLELQARVVVSKSANYDDDHIKLEEDLRSVRNVSRNFDAEAANFSPFVRAFMKHVFARYYIGLTNVDLDKDDIADLMAMAIDDLNEAQAIARRSKDTALRDYMRNKWLAVASRTNQKGIEKDLKEALTEVRKTDNYAALIEISNYLADFYLPQRGGPQKAYEVHVDTVRRGFKRVSEGGFFLVTKGMKSINDILLRETIRPGVSWIVKELASYFETIAEMVDAIESNIEHIGSDLFAKFQEEFLRMEPATHFNLKVYLRYQFYEIKMLRAGAIVRGDAPSQRIAERLLNELTQENSPMSFIQANWEEFKDVPNSVRNKVLNKCISISKGDLPMAAEHLDFSYRNLRSYITFKEVNRLGFFLDEQATNNRQLEQGIRLLFFDLYKNGTIFEVVFDMPKFLVEHAKSGFSSQDLEEALDIKGTTAKKYIKIMMEIGLIKLERSVGRKHFYKLRKDNVMNRLGKDQKVLAS